MSDQRASIFPGDPLLHPASGELEAIAAQKQALITLEIRQKQFPPARYRWSQSRRMESFNPALRLLAKDEVHRARTCANIHLYDLHFPDSQLNNLEYWRKERRREYEWQCLDGSFLQQVQLFCTEAGLKECQWPRCVAQRNLLDKVMPSCGKWRSFREWALIAGACQLSAAILGHQWLGDFSWFQFDALVYWSLVPGHPSPDDRTTVFEVCNIAYFLLDQVQKPYTRVADRLLRPRISDPHLWAWNNGSIPPHIILPSIEHALERSATLGICKNRFWNLAYSSDRGPADLHALMELAEDSANHASFQHKGHEACNSELCIFQDENNTLKLQLHKCSDPRACYTLKFPIEELDDAMDESRSTAWPIAGIEQMESTRRSLARESTKFMAISHVWSDGTGVGIESPGKVNKCLIKYFEEIAIQLGCDGIWWDTICIPPGREQRRKAISNMHENYARAEHTIIHDTYLLQFDWVDDGSAALALILSPWFTRGWAALELAVSKSVKVLFRDPKNPSIPLIKDLDADILASDGSLSKPGHVVATTVINRLRKKALSISDLLMIMKSRSTSWKRDRMAIVSLLARVPDFDYGDSPMAATKKLVRSSTAVPAHLLLHGHETLSPSGGPFSWCPSNLLHAPARVIKLGKWHRSDQRIDTRGAVTGFWHARILKTEDKALLKPYAFHLSIDYRIRKTLEYKWQDCLLLDYYADAEMDDLPSLLVTVAGVSVTFRQEIYIDCHYVGCVHPYEPRERQRVRPPALMRIGCDREKPTSPAKDVLDEYIRKNEEKHKQFLDRVDRQEFRPETANRGPQLNSLSSRKRKRSSLF